MNIQTRGAYLNLSGTPLRGSTAARRSGISIGGLELSGRDCIQECLNGGSWQVSQSSHSTPDGAAFAGKAWSPVYKKNANGVREFTPCECPAFNSSYQVSVQVTVYGVPGQVFSFYGGRSPLEGQTSGLVRAGGEPDYNPRGILSSSGFESVTFTYTLLHSETDGTLPPPTFSASAFLGERQPIISAGVVPAAELFSNCFVECTREVNQVQVPVWTGCLVDNRESAMLRALAARYTLHAYSGQSINAAMTNLPEPGLEDLVAIKIKLPSTTVKMVPPPRQSGALVGTFDSDFSVYKIESFEDGVATATRRLTYVGPFTDIQSPRVSLDEYFGRETIIVMFKNKYPGAVTNYSTPDIGESCVMEGDGFVSNAGRIATSEITLTATVN